MFIPSRGCFSTKYRTHYHRLCRGSRCLRRGLACNVCLFSPACALVLVRVPECLLTHRPTTIGTGHLSLVTSWTFRWRWRWRFNFLWYWLNLFQVLLRGTLRGTIRGVFHLPYRLLFDFNYLRRFRRSFIWSFRRLFRRGFRQLFRYAL